MNTTELSQSLNKDIDGVMSEIMSMMLGSPSRKKYKTEEERKAAKKASNKRSHEKWKNKLTPEQIEQRREYQREYNKTFRANMTPEQKKKKNDSNKKSSAKVRNSDNIESHAKIAVSAAKSRCKEEAKQARGITCEITSDHVVHLYILQGGKCAITNRVMTTKCNTRDKLSLDRIDSTKGYIIGNCQLVSTIVNKMKSDLSDEEFKSLINDIYHGLNRD